MVSHPSQTQDRAGKHSVENRDNTGYRDAIMTPPNNNQNSGERPYQGAPWIHYFVCLIIAVCPIQFFSNVFDLSCNVLVIIHRTTRDIVLEGWLCNIGSTISIGLERNCKVLVTLSVTSMPQLQGNTSALLKLKSGSKEPLTKKLLQRFGYNPQNYGGHSFRRGAATWAGSVGLSDYDIKMLGYWSSDCFFTIY
jgi:hypothetical protein